MDWTAERLDPPNLGETVTDECAGDVRDRSERFVGETDPELTRTLAALGLDIEYTSAKGAYLSYRDRNGRTQTVVDFIAGYGAVLLGHAQPAIQAAIEDFLRNKRPVFCQGSSDPSSHRLSQILASRVGGNFVIRYGNTGAECVEIALKHAMLETGGSTFVTLENGFHGKSIAISTAQHTDSDKHGLRFLRVAPDDPAKLKRVLRSTQDLAGCLFEPIQGEGGVRPVPAEIQALLRRECSARGVPLIADECQTGIGRTGPFLASTVRPNYVCLSKQLGGGMAKISACLIEQNRYQPEFDWQHSSTFARDGLATHIALATLDELDSQVQNQVQATGQAVLDQLCALQEQFPSVIRDIRGAGLMLGIEFHRRPADESFLTRLLHGHEMLVHVIAAYLFHVHNIRVAPTLGDRWTLRLHGMLAMTNDDWDRLYNGLEDVCAFLANDDTCALLLNIKVSTQHPKKTLELCKPWVHFHPGSAIGKRSAETPKVAWLCHLIDEQDIADNDSCFSELEPDDRQSLLNRLLPCARPVLMSQPLVASSCGTEVELFPILLPATSRMFRMWLEQDELEFPRHLVRAGVKVARSLGCQMVALGQYTSIVTGNGHSLADFDIGLTTGNAFAAALAEQAILAQIQEMGKQLSQLTLGVVGASGNIGRILSKRLSRRFASTILCSSRRAGANRQLRRLARRWHASHVAEDLRALRRVDVVLSTVSAAEPILRAHHIKQSAIVCDLSVPASTLPCLEARSDLTLIKGGIVQLPCDEDLGIASFPVSQGQTFACMAEGLLLGMAGRSDKQFTGAICDSDLVEITTLANQFGFKLAGSKTQSVYGKPAEAVNVDH